jgi:SnoaL-like domain
MSNSLSVELRERIRTQILDLEIDYWHDVDFHWGRNAHAMYAADGVFIISEQKMVGPEGVKAFYSWREGRGDRVARHVVTNLRVTVHSADQADLVGIMCLFAADGKPVLPSTPPILIADVISEFVLGADGVWRFKRHELVPLFAGGAAITLPPASANSR